MSKIIKKLGLATVLTLGVTHVAAAKDTIVIGEVSWDASLAIEQVLKQVMEKHLDVNVKIVATDQSAIWASMDKGKGSIDVHPDVWTSSQAEPWAKFVVKGGKESVLANQKPYMGTEGLFIPGYIQEKYGVKSVYDLAKPEIAKLFDQDGDGKGDFWPGAPGWGIVKVNQVKAKSYGFDQYFKAFHVSDAILRAQLKTAFRKKTGILFYSWTPDWIHKAYDLRKLEEPTFTGYASQDKQQDPHYNPDGCWNMVQGDEWLEKSSITCDWPETKVYLAYSKSLLSRNAQVAEFLNNVSFTTDDISQWIYQIAQEKEAPEDVAEEWINNNPAVVKQWLNQS
ncbi:ABC transporter substrate-binding protein [Endozoicomonas sp. SM1973]|uniref:ABC transporter substrate-binding protein n=1 Tax=Spartinivicinus marinus TaxID=2994442 RepID=A0A853I2W4_9GAMM|nr:glycine betaine ABC transporter substrate-binding protein [Spartinivicinus marinus]MCX4029474.1 hypothetical protein [Spartinivicinus marinus]NYZ65048.1 ABC transporter substrate-binding protein [Spartinivicinus marinus]